MSQQSRRQHGAHEPRVHRVRTKAFTAVTAVTLGSRVGCINFVEYLWACWNTRYCADAKRVYYLLLTGLRTSVRYNLYQVLVLRASCVPEKVGVNKRGLDKRIAVLHYKLDVVA
jgi:hypothetical protein